MRRLLFTSLILAALSTQCLAQGPVKVKSHETPAGVLDVSLAQEASAATRRGLDWLAANQKKDGSWSNADYPALTALALWPFLLSDHPDKEQVVDKAVKFIKTYVQKDGGIYRDVKGRTGGGLSNYNTAICMSVLHATGRPDVIEIVLDARKFIAGAQHFGGDEYKGGFGYDSSTDRAYADLLNTYYSIEAMKATESVEEVRPKGEKKVDINWAETVKFIERIQNKAEAGKDQEGGFFYKPGQSKAGNVTNANGKVFFRS